MAQVDYYPPGINLPGLIPAELPPSTILCYFFIPVLVLIYAAYQFSGRQRFGLTKTERITFVWFLLCSLIHTFFEGYYVINSAQIGSRTELFAQIWKEYAKSDSRYLTNDSTVLAIEMLTCSIMGSLSLLCCWYILRKNTRQYTLQLFISTGQLYGVLIYYLAAGFESFAFCSPKPLHFWGYFVGTNAFWVFMPLWVIKNAAKTINNQFQKIKKN